MANPFGLQEVTLNQLGDSTHAINQIDTTGANAASPRKSAYQPIVAIVTNHDNTTSNLTDWPDGGGSPTETANNEEHMNTKIAVFHCKRHGEPWTLGSNRDAALQHIIHQTAGVPAVPTDATIVYPNWDYTTFE